MSTAIKTAEQAVRRHALRLPGPVAGLALVAVAYVLAQVAVGALGAPMDLDEAVYASQFSAAVPRIPYAAHRSYGEGLLAAPVVLVTSSVFAIRVYFAVLSGVLLFLAYRPWSKAPGAVLAAALFAFTWVSLRFGDVVVPNMPVALLAVGAAGLVAYPGRRTWLALLAATAALTLLRPTDAVCVVAPLLLGALLVPAWRRTDTVAAITGGMAIGGAQWLAESFERFGGPLTRMHAIAEVNGGDGVHFNLVRNLEALSGKESCLPKALSCGPLTLAALLWWIGGLALVALGVGFARRSINRRALLLCLGTAAACGIPYIFLTDWGVPRYLLPVYALLAVPGAAGVVGVLASARTMSKAAFQWTAAGAALLLLVQFGLQLAAADRATRASRLALGWPVQAAGALGRHGISGRCAVLGRFAPQIAFLRRCHAADMYDGIRHRTAAGNVSEANIKRLRNQGLRVVVVKRRDMPVPDTWQSIDVPGTRSLRLYLAT